MLLAGVAAVAFMVISVAYYLANRGSQQPVAPQTPSSVTQLPPPLAIEIWEGNTTTKTTLEPIETKGSFNATYKYAGNGWIHIKGEFWAFNIRMPPWKKIRIYVNYTTPTTKIYGKVLVVVRGQPVYAGIGVGFYTIPTTVFTVDRRLVDFYNRALEENNFNEEKMEKFFYSEREFYSYVTCYDTVNKEFYQPIKLMLYVPQPKIILNPGDLVIEGIGEMWILVQVLE